MFPRAPRLVSFPCFSTAPSRFLSSFPRKLRSPWKSADLGPKSKISQIGKIPGVFCGYTWKNPGIPGEYPVSPQILPQTSSQTQGNSRVARMELQTPSGFPGNFRKRKVLGTLWFPFWFPETWIQANGWVGNWLVGLTEIARSRKIWFEYLRRESQKPGNLKFIQFNIS